VARPSAKRFFIFFRISLPMAPAVGKLFLPTSGHRQSYGHFADGLPAVGKPGDLLTHNPRFADGWPSANLGFFFPVFLHFHDISTHTSYI
jgi:hypothetical protein